MALDNKRSFIKVMIAFIFASSLLFFFQPPVVEANYDPVLDLEEEGEKPSVIEKQLIKLLVNFGNWLIDVSNAQDVSVLVFQDKSVLGDDDKFISNTTSADRENMIMGIFPSGLFDGISAFYDFFSSLLPIPMVVLISLGGLFLLFDVMKSNETRSKVKEILLGVVAVILLIRFGVFLWSWLIDINYFIVDSIRAVLAENGVVISRFTQTIFDSSQASDLSGVNNVGVAVLVIVAIFMTFVINYQYMMRLIQLSMLVVLFPIAMLSAMMPTRKSVINIWFTAFTSNVFLQAAHAVSLGLFFYALTNAPEIGFWLVMAMLFGLPSMADVVNRIVSGFTGEGAGGGLKTSAGNMSGVAGLMAISKIGSTVLGGKSKGSSSTSKNESKVNSQTESESKFGNMLGGGTSDGMNANGADGAKGSTTAPVGPGGNGQSTLDKGAGADSKSSQTRTQRNHGVKAGSSAAGAGARALKGASRVAGGVAKTGGKLARSQAARQAVKGGTVLAAASAGAIAGTMVTGKAGTGAVVGASIGQPLGKLAGSAQEKIGKGMQYGGEMVKGQADHALGRTDSAQEYTNERLGFTDKAQMYDKQEMGRMGEELIGGKTGRAIGSAVGSANEFIGRNFGNESAKEAIQRVDSRKDLNGQIEESRGFEKEAYENKDMAQSNYQSVRLQYGDHTEAGQQWKQETQKNFEETRQAHKSDPKNVEKKQAYDKAKEDVKKPHPKVQEAEKEFKKHDQVHAYHSHQTKQLQKQQELFYKTKNKATQKSLQADDMSKFKTNHKQSGQL